MWSAISQKLDDRWLPKSVICLREYSLNKFLRDVIAGITVGLVALPLAMAFAIASGLTPQAGIYCAVGPAFSSPHWADRRLRSAGPPARLWWWLRESSPFTALTGYTCAQ